MDNIVFELIMPSTFYIYRTLNNLNISIYMCLKASRKRIDAA